MKFAVKSGEKYILWSFEFCLHGEKESYVKFFELNEDASVFKPTLAKHTIGELTLKNGEVFRLVDDEMPIARVCHRIIRDMKEALGDTRDNFPYTFFNRRLDILSSEQIGKVILTDNTKAKKD